jgi:hypothetical protein
LGATITGGDDELGFGFRLFKGMQKDNLGYIYRGLFTQTITDSIIGLAEANLETTGESSKVKKRVFSILVECLQNITRHQTENCEDHDDPSMQGIFIIQKKESFYYITTGNVVKHSAIPKLRSQLEKINSFEQDGLKDYYKQILEDGTISDKGGAGLGLIEMARKSGNKLSFDFAKINEKVSYFYLHTAVSKEQEQAPAIHIDLENIKNIHQIVNDEDILLVFNGVLNQESLINLLSIIEGQMRGSLDMKKKVFNVMVEMLQNIVKHATKIDEDNASGGNPGIFFISSKNNNYTLCTGNYVLNKHVEELDRKLSHVNELKGEELDLFYSMRLLNFEIDNSKEAGLGIIDLRMKSGRKLDFDFSKVDDNASFFTLQITI